MSPFHTLASSTAYTYDNSDRLNQEVYNSGKVINYAYDKLGNRLSKEVLASEGAIILLTPNGGEQWQPGTTETISWTHNNTAGTTVKIELYKGATLNKTLTAGVAIGTNGSGSFVWAIPASQTPGTDYSLKITSTSNTALSDSSSAPFTIESTPAFTVVAPAAGAGWGAGSTQNISWTYGGDPGSSVRLDLLKGGVLHSTLTQSAPIGTNGSGTYAWTIAASQEPGSNYQLRIATPTGKYAGTSASFSILGGISVDAPYSCEAGAWKTLSWDYTGNPGPEVKIELWKNGVLNRTIAAATPVGNNGSGSFDWLIPSDQVGGSDFSLRIVSTSNGAYSGTSSNTFAIAAPSITVSSPNGGNTWEAGETQNISWNYQGVPGSAVKIELLKNGAVNKTLAASHPIGSGGYGSFTWQVPLNQTPGTDYTLRVTSTANAAYTDVSNSNFTIAAPGLSVSYPNGGNSWAPGSLQQISWYYQGDPGPTVKIELLKGGVLNETLSTAAPVGSGGSGSYYWAIPAGKTVGSDYTIRITSTSNSAYTDVSNANFSITPGNTVSVLSPKGGETWLTGSSRTIQWNYAGNVGTTLTLELLKNGSLNSTIATGISIGSGGTGSYAWTVPSGQTAGTDYKIRVRSSQGYSDTSKFNFTITDTSAVTLMSFFGGEEVQAGSTQTIQWSYAGNPGTAVTLELLKGGTLNQTIIASTPLGSGGIGSYSWTLPTGLADASNYQIRITCGSSTFTGGYFSVVPSLLRVSSPYGGYTWEGGNLQTIQWYYDGEPGPAVKIELFKAGVLKTTIAAATPIGSYGSGSSSWLVPVNQEPGADYTVRITSVTNTAYTAQSAPFSITAPGFSVRYPNGNNTLSAGGMENIRWYYDGNPGESVKIELLKNSALNTVIAAAAPVGTGGSGEYPWLIPPGQTSGADYSIRLTSTSNAAYTDESDSRFTILAPAITVSTPNGNESWETGSLREIRWYADGDPGNTVKIELLKGGALNRTITAGTPVGDGGSGSYFWLIPSDLAAGTDYTIRISSTSNASYSDVSNANFSIILPGITVTSPNGGESLEAGRLHTFQWTYKGQPGPAVKLELLKAGAVQTTVISHLAIGSSGNGSYQWFMPEGQALGADYALRVTSTSNSTYTDQSNSNFAIVQPKISLTSPSGGERWPAGTTQTINWTHNNSGASTVSISLLKGGSTSQTLASNIPIGAGGTGSFSWAIPTNQVPTSDYAIRITSNNNYSDTSANEFSIIASSETGSLTCTLAPEEAITAGAQWRIDGGPWKNSGVTITGLATGPHTLSFKGITGWDMPLSKLVAINKGQIKIESGTYVQQPESLKVTIMPEAAVTAGAQWRVDGGVWLTSGSVVSNFTPGQHTIQFSDASGWSKPQDEIVTTSGATSLTRTYSYAAMTVASPNGGESLSAGDVYAITWGYNGMPGGTVSIELLQGGNVVAFLGSDIPIELNAFSWQIPQEQTHGNEYRVRIFKDNNRTLSDTSDNNFTIVAKTPGNSGGAFATWPDTGQTRCYSNSQVIACPAPGEDFFGQDAQHNGPARSFFLLGNGTMVEDHVTGLIWQRKANKDGVYDYNNLNDADNTYTWCDSNPVTNGGNQGTCGEHNTEEFITDLNNSNFGGYDDWRLPTYKELLTLLDKGRAAPAIDPIFASTEPDGSAVTWSSTVVAGKQTSAWAAAFQNGGDYHAEKSDLKYARAVRGGQSIDQIRFVDHSDGTVTDTVTCLQWQKNALDSTGDGKADGHSWQQTLAVAENYNLAGNSDWRLPDLNELLSLVDYSQANPAIDPVFTAASETPGDEYFWTSTTSVSIDGSHQGALLVDFTDGRSFFGDKSQDGYYARLVRGKQCGGPEVAKGDYNKDGAVDLSDVLIALRVIAGFQSIGNIEIEAEVNGDQKIGLEEVMFSIQKLAGLR